MVAMAAQMGSPDNTDAPNSVVGRRASAARVAKCCERSSLSLECRRRSKFEPPCRLNIEPGVEADFYGVGCG